jgi:cytoskeleton protein RodZ
LNPLMTVDEQDKSVGLILRETRESRGLTLEDVAKVTRIGKSYLSNLEEEKFDKLPSGAYIKGFLRVYSAYLGLPEQEIIALYEKKVFANNLEIIDLLSGTKPTQEEKFAAGTGKRRWFALSGFIIVAVAALYLIQDMPGRKSSRKVETVSIPVIPNPQTVAPPQKQAAPPYTDPENLNLADEAKETNKQPGINDGSTLSKGVVLKIKVIEDGWLDIAIDDTITQHYELKSGDVIEWKGENVFTLDVSNAGGIEAVFNGKQLKPFGGIGEPAHISLKSEDK